MNPDSSHPVPRGSWRHFPSAFRIAIIVFALFTILPALYGSRYIITVGAYDHEDAALAPAANLEVFYIKRIVAVAFACTIVVYIWAWIHTRFKHSRAAAMQKPVTQNP